MKLLFCCPPGYNNTTSEREMSRLTAYSYLTRYTNHANGNNIARLLYDFSGITHKYFAPKSIICLKIRNLALSTCNY